MCQTSRGNAAMTRDARLDLIERLQPENAESRAELVLRAAAREADPARALEEMIAEHRNPIGARYMRENGSPADFIFKTTANRPADDATGDATPSYAEPSDTDRAVDKL